MSEARYYPQSAIARLWRPMTDAEFDDLKADINLRGQLMPVVLYHGEVLDGWHRQRACKALGIKPSRVLYEVYHGDDPVGHASALNDKRRHLSDFTRARMAVELTTTGHGGKRTAGVKGVPGANGNEAVKASMDALPITDAPVESVTRKEASAVTGVSTASAARYARGLRVLGRERMDELEAEGVTLAGMVKEVKAVIRTRETAYHRAIWSAHVKPSNADQSEIEPPPNEDSGLFTGAEDRPEDGFLASPAMTGGKSRRGINYWIQAHLPIPAGKDSAYIEPFCGFMGVLINRKRAPLEIVNDANENIANFWRGVRDYPNELTHMLKATPHSRALWNEARAIVNDPDAYGVKRGSAKHAWAISVVIVSGVSKTIEATGFALRYTMGRENTGELVFSHNIRPLAKRIEQVQLETGDALAMLERVKALEDAVIYADPPYKGSSVNDGYGVKPLDWNAFERALRDQRGKVAVSGYGDALDGLGWRKRTLNTVFVRQGKNTTAKRGSPRTECLWMNYPETDEAQFIARAQGLEKPRDRFNREGVKHE